MFFTANLVNPSSVYTVRPFIAAGQSLPMAADAVLPPGKLAAVDAKGNAVPAADVAGLKVAGVAAGSPPHPGNDRETVANKGRVAGFHQVYVKTGLYLLENSAASPVDAADLGQSVFVHDAQTVAKATSNRVVAGVAIGLEGKAHVWVFIGALPGSPSLASP